MGSFKRNTQLQKMALDKLTEAVREYLKVIEIPEGARHRKTTFVFVGDRYKPVEIDCHFVRPKNKGDGAFIMDDATE